MDSSLNQPERIISTVSPHRCLMCKLELFLYGICMQSVGSLKGHLMLITNFHFEDFPGQIVPNPRDFCRLVFSNSCFYGSWTENRKISRFLSKPLVEVFIPLARPPLSTIPRARFHSSPNLLDLGSEPQPHVILSPPKSSPGSQTAIPYAGHSGRTAFVGGTIYTESTSVFHEIFPLLSSRHPTSAIGWENTASSCPEQAIPLAPSH
jgi:hypothetical protein